MKELQVRRQMLPDNMKDLTRFVLIGREKLVSVRAEIRAINKIGLATEVREQKNREAQDLAGALLDAESKIGELLKETVRAGNPIVTVSGQLPEGITRNQSSQFQSLAEHKDLIEEVKREAQENDDLPTRTEVLRKIKQLDLQEKKQEYADRITNTDKSISIDIFNTGKKFKIIYADPCWSYNDKQDFQALGGAEKHYQTMSIEELCKLPVNNISEDNSVLFIWVTSPMLEDSFKVINSWGFKYKTSFVWDKISHNMGHYNSVRHELLLVCTKGNCLPDNKKLYDSVVSVERSSQHSEKPIEFMNIIDDIYTFGDRIELFARDKKKDSWFLWGNEI